MHRFMTALLAGLLCLPLLLPAPAGAQLVERKAEGEPTTDKEFLVRAIACEVAEVKFAEKAAKNATNEDVRKLAETMAADHKEIRDKLLEQAKKMKLAVVEGLDKKHREQYDKMAKLEGAEFDREYMKCLVEGHEKSVKLYKKWSKDADDAGIREAAAAALTKAEDHLAKAKKLRAKVKE